MAMRIGDLKNFPWYQRFEPKTGLAVSWGGWGLQYEDERALCDDDLIMVNHAGDVLLYCQSPEGEVDTWPLCYLTWLEQYFIYRECPALFAPLTVKNPTFQYRVIDTSVGERSLCLEANAEFLKGKLAAKARVIAEGLPDNSV